MNNKLMWAVVGVVVVAAGAWIAFEKGGGKESEQATTGSTQPRSLKALLVAGKSQKCEFSDTSSGTEMKATSYVSGGKMRSDASIVSGGKTMMTHTIVDDNVAYSWSDGVAQGFKMAFDATAAAKNDEAIQQTLDANKEFDFVCNPWSADASKFALPSGINFLDVSAMMGAAAGASVTGGTSAGTNAQCSICDSAPSGSKEKCLVALGCKN